MENINKDLGSLGYLSILTITFIISFIVTKDFSVSLKIAVLNFYGTAAADLLLFYLRVKKSSKKSSF